MFFIFKPWTDSLGICAEKIFKSSAQQHPSPTQECNLHPWSGFQDPTEQSPEQPGVKKVGSRTRVLPGLPATQIIHDAMRALLSSRDDSGDHPASGGCRAGWVPWAQGASLCLPICTAAFLSGCLIWRQGQKKKKKMRWLLRHIVSCTVGLQWIGIVQGRATWADFSAPGYIYPLSLVIGL